MNATTSPQKAFVEKAYRNRAEILAHLRAEHPEIPEHLWGEHEVDWQVGPSKLLEFRQRLNRGENPVTLAKKLLPTFTHGGREVRAFMRTVVGSKDSLDYWLYRDARNGGFWESTHRKMGDSLLKDICLEFCNFADGCTSEGSRARVVDGSLPGRMLSEVAPALFDPNLLRRLNDESSWKYLQFSCGTVFNRELMVTEPGRAENYISLTTGYDYPAAAMEEIAARLASQDLDLRAVLEEVKRFEDGLVVGEYVRLPAGLEDKLARIADTDGMQLLKIVYSMFESWPVALYRGGKLLAGGLFALPFEVFVHDRGDQGNNGKTVLQTISADVNGTAVANMESGAP